MNKQRKVLITITYNEMGIIIDTKAEEVAQPNLQPTCNQLATDTISRQAAIDAIGNVPDHDDGMVWEALSHAQRDVALLPSTQPDVVTASLEELINDYGEDGFFIVDGVNYQANELLNELKINSSVGEKFRKQIAQTIVQYFMKFGG